MKIAKKKKNTIAKTRKRNLDHRDADHPVSVVHYWRQGPPGYLTPWQRAHHAGQQGLFEHGIVPAKLRHKNPPGSIEAIEKRIIALVETEKTAGKNISQIQEKLFQKYGYLLRRIDASHVVLYGVGGKDWNIARKKQNPSKAEKKAIQNRKEFAGHVDGEQNLYVPDGTPDGLSKIGGLALLILKNGQKIKGNSATVLVQDNKHKLHLASTKSGPMVPLAEGDHGEIVQVEYIEKKSQLNDYEPVLYYHRLGELNGKRPRLIVDDKGQARIVGGDYRITWRGIEN